MDYFLKVLWIIIFGAYDYFDTCGINKIDKQSSIW